MLLEVFAEVAGMTRRTALLLSVLGAVVLLTALPALAEREPQPMDILDALATGQVDAVFYGNGDSSVTGRVRRGAFGPERLYVAPGTQFWAQADGDSLQGMTTLGWVPIDLSRRPYAYVEIPTACTNYNRPAPTRYDRMIAVCCPDRRMAVLSEYIGRVHPSRPAAQLAVWAIANNPQWSEVAGYVEGHVEGGTPEARAERVDAIRSEAAALMRQAGFTPSRFRVFQD